MSDSQIGKVDNGDSLVLRQFIGSMGPQDDPELYELSTAVATGQPLIRNTKTSRMFFITWPELLELARAAGIDNPVERVDD